MVAAGLVEDYAADDETILVVSHGPSACRAADRRLPPAQAPQGTNRGS
jgi:hypothetical protein